MENYSNLKIGICCGGFCPMHQGHLDILMNAKKENDVCFVGVCGYDREGRAEEIGLPLNKRVNLIKELFKDDEQVIVFSVDDGELGIANSFLEENWDIWIKHIYNMVYTRYPGYKNPTWYVAEKEYESSLKRRGEQVKCYPKSNSVSGTLIREKPLTYWNKITSVFRPYLTKNILITGTASEGKSTLVRDIGRYFNLPYCEEYGRTYMENKCLFDTDLNFDIFKEFLIGQRADIVNKMHSPGNNGVVISDTDNLVTLMYAKVYADDPNMKYFKQKDYEMLYNMAVMMDKDITWEKIFLLKPRNKFVNDGTRYMVQSVMEERIKNYNVLVQLLKEFNLWHRVEILDGDYLQNFNSVKDYINDLYDIL